MSFDERGTALIDLLDELTESHLEYVLVGAYAVSAYNTRFSTDLDLVVMAETETELIEFLEERDFEETDSHEKQWAYDTAVIEYQKRLGPQQPIGVDLLVDGLGCRQTGAQWSFDYLRRHSTTRSVRGGSATTTASVVEGPVLVAAKLHSGRETDIRDVLAIAEDIDLETVTPHLHRGNDDDLRSQLERGLEILESDELRQGFRSDFGASTVSESTVSTLKEYLSRQVRRRS